MQLHELAPKHKKKEKKRVGRGGKKGTYSGRGIKGQKARAGHKLMPVIRELIKRVPKMRGYRFKKKTKTYPLVTINVSLLEKNFEKSEVVDKKKLLEKQLISKIKGKVPKVKILGKGKLTKPLIIKIKDCLFSKKAKEIIEKAGGEIKS